MGRYLNINSLKKENEVFGFTPIHLNKPNK